MLRPGARPEAERGETNIGPGVVSAVAARAALEVPGVVRSEPSAVARVMRRSGGGLPGASANVEGDQASVELQVTLTYPAPVWSTAEAVRQRVRQQVRAYTGLEVGAVDLQVAALMQPQPRRSRVE